MTQNEEKDLPWEAAIRTALESTDGALHYAEIAESISSQGLRKKLGANPAATVLVTLSNSLRDERSPFQRTGRGEYALKPQVRPVAPTVEDVAQQDVIAETGALGAFGMYWRRDQVIWTIPMLLGRQQIGASAVNFSDQVGVYLLHDRDRVIYVGRTSDTLFARLKSHDSDRLSGRWDRFSWFGLRRVGDDGKLLDPPASWKHDVVIDTLEALLIECLEPPLNRRRGDNLSGIEYQQVPDPEIEKKRQKEVLAKLAQKI